MPLNDKPNTMVAGSGLGIGGSTLLRRLLALALLILPANMPAMAGGQLEITVVDRETGEPIACRMHLKNSRGRPQKPRRVPFWDDHFAFDGKIALQLPVGDYTFEMERGPEYLTRTGHFRIENFADDVKQVDLGRFVDMSEHGWWSGDLDVRRPLQEIELLMEADDLHVAQVATWSNGENPWRDKPLPEELPVLFDEDRYYHPMAGRHARAGTELLLFNLPEPPPWAGHSTSNDPAGEYPASIQYALEARRHEGAWVDSSRPYWWDLPMLVAAGQIDSIQVAHANLCRETAIDSEGDGKPRDRKLYPAPHGNARWSQDVYFKLLECGLRIPPTAGSGSGAAPNPIGYNRVYVHVDSEFTYDRWFENLRGGRVMVTNGPLLRPAVNGQLPGYVFRGDAGEKLEFEIGLTLSTREPISYLEIVKNGRVARSIRFADYAASGRLPGIEFEQSGWFLLRVVTDQPKTHRFAMTGPYYVEIGGRRRISKQAVQFFLDWIYQRARQIQLPDPAKHREVLDYHRRARDFWQALAAQANAE